MRRSSLIWMMVLLSAAMASAAATPEDASESVDTPVSCGNGVPGGINCVASKKDLRAAHDAYSRGLKLRDHQHVEQAFAEFDRAVRLAPQDPQFLTAREMVKSQLVYGHVERGNALLSASNYDLATSEFRAALELDPDNEFARQRLQDASRDSVPAPITNVPAWFSNTGEVRLQPNNTRATFHFSGGVRDLFAQLASAYGATPQFDDSVVVRQVRFNVDEVDFFTALRLACQVSKTMWTALDAHQFLLAADTPENHRQYDRMSLRTFILPAHSTPQEATDFVTTMRNMFDLHFVSPGQTANTVEVRGPQAIIEACTKLMAQLSEGRPQVLLDVRVYQIDHQLARDIGVHIPNTFNMFNIPAAALAGLGGQNIQDLINQLIASGGINQAGNSALSGLLAQLGGQQNSIFSNPLATFGGGLTFMGLSLDHLTAALSLNESWVRSLEDVRMRASQGNDATFHLGTRYPILNASYAPIFNSAAIAQVLGNQTYVPPFPSVSYEDLGLNLKAKPVVHASGDVSLQLELQVRSLTGQSNNGVPVISNREYKGSINLRDGEPAVVAGEISQTEQRSLSGIPGLGFIPGLNQATVSNTVQDNEDELMVIITPHVLNNIERVTPEIWLSER
jgi:type II secretory pathway component GspD/PulD (secretin)